MPPFPQDAAERNLKPVRWTIPLRWLGGVAALLMAAVSLGAEISAKPSPAETPVPTVFEKADPQNLADLLAMEEHVRKIAKKVIPTTVNVQVGNAQGSGVIVSKDGYVLTAAHVIGGPGRDVLITLSDGRRLKGESLGLNRRLDVGLVKILEEGTWPIAEMGDLKSIEVGEWCLATGHPGGYRRDRPPVLRLGRVILVRDSILQTDCTLVGGDSGGPLFDVQGRVIGINSRIGASLAWNFHVPVSAYQENWERLVKAESWGDRPNRPAQGPVLGVSGDDHADGCQVTAVGEDLPAEEAGLQIGDVITQFDGKPVKGFDSLASLVRNRKPGDRVSIEFVRGEETFRKVVQLAKRS